ncbi:MAG TPA: hypothetical protein VFX02_14175 [Gammaproteobacteria bacterium]|nr:hypothetical protein [Gammaproteobacteria bacterium]
MKKLITLFFLVILASPGHADQCTERVIRLNPPVFPKTLEEIQILKKERYCVLHVAYSINMDGKAENINYMAEKEICKRFNVPAIRAIRSSQFSGGDYVELCFIKLTLGLENGETNWSYTYD